MIQSPRPNEVGNHIEPFVKDALSSIGMKAEIPLTSLMVGFEIVREKRNGKSVFVPIHWKLYTLEKMLVQVKHEFNASNKGMYKPEALLAEGGIK